MAWLSIGMFAGVISAIKENPLLLSRRTSAPSSTAASIRPTSNDWLINTEAFAAQLLGGFDIGRRDNRMRQLAGDRSKDFQIETLGGRPQNRGTAGIADFDI